MVLQRERERERCSSQEPACCISPEHEERSSHVRVIIMSGIFQKEILGEKSASQSTDVLLVINWWLISGLIETYFMLD